MEARYAKGLQMVLGNEYVAKISKEDASWEVVEMVIRIPPQNDMTRVYRISDHFGTGARNRVLVSKFSKPHAIICIRSFPSAKTQSMKDQSSRTLRKRKNCIP